MPQVGERKTKNGITGEWDGQTWRQVSTPTEDPSSSGVLSRFFSGALSTSPLNPMNAAHAIMHPIDTAGNALSDSLHGVQDAVSHASDAITNPNNEGWLGRLTEAVQAIKGAGSAVPFIGKAATNAGDKIGNGDIAGGAGELAGLASGAALPEVASRTPGALSKAGSLAESAGDALVNAGSHTPLGRTLGLTLPAAGAAEALFGSHPYVGAAAATVPYALKYGGKGVSALGDMLQSLKPPLQGEIVPEPEPEPSFREGEIVGGYTPAPPSSVLQGRALPPASEPAAARTVSPAEADNILQDSPYGRGQVIPSGMRPSELTDAAEEGNVQHTPVDLGYYGLPTTPTGSVDLLEGGPESGRFPTPTREGQEVPTSEDVDSLIRGLMPQGTSTSAPAAASPSPLSFRMIDRGDEYWGPGTTDRTGAPSMADESNRMLYDPQTPTSYLRDQLSSATDDADRSFLAKAIRQRYNIQRRPGSPVAVNQ